MNNRNISTFSPFITFCQHVIPLAYDESMSYYETLCALRDYLVNTVIPAVNNNADAVTELQNAFIKLQNYIDNYFNNLDVQTEINNKLDQMAESGELTDIIAQYLQLASILAFNTRTDLKNASNLNEGSFTYCYGKESYNDGYPAFYKIRKLINTDEIDDEQLIRLTNYPTLVAEKIPNKIYDENFTNINNEISGINEDIAEINEKITKIDTKITLIIGDSYTSNEESSKTLRGGADSWVTSYENYTTNTVVNLADDGAGFIQTGDRGTTFLTQLQNWVAQNQDKINLVENIILYGGINDIRHGYQSQMITGLTNYLNYVCQNFKDKNIYILFLNEPVKVFTNDEINIMNEASVTASKFPVKFINACGFLFGSSNLMMSDNLHPNEAGCNRIYECIQAFTNGSDGPSQSFSITGAHLTAPHNQDIPSSAYTVTNNTRYYPLLGKVKGKFNINFSSLNRLDNGETGRWEWYTNLNAVNPYYNPCPINYSTQGGTYGYIGYVNTDNNSGLMRINLNMYNAGTSRVLINVLAFSIDYRIY